MAVIEYNDVEKAQILLQCSDEYRHALEYRRKRETNWQTIDDLYYGQKKKSLVTRANVHVPKMQGTIETFISKVDDNPTIRYEAVEEGDRPKEAKMNALIVRDMALGDWRLKDVLAKKEGALYGRAILKKYSMSPGGMFEDHLDVVDCLDFLIDPLAGGLTPMQTARYMGQDNIVKSVHELDDADIYDVESMRRMATRLMSDMSVDNRYASLAARRTALGLSNAVLVSEDSVKLVEWITTWKGERVFCLFSPEFMEAVRMCPLKEVFASDEFPYATWAPFARLGEFWTPGIGELVKEPNIIQNVILSQILDNNAYRNYGMKAYDSTKVANPAELIPKPMGKVAINGNPREAIMEMQFPTLDNAVAAYNLIENIFDKEVGVNANAKGMPNTKRMSATEFAGLLDQVADRFFAANHTYQSCLRRLGQLYYYGVEENLDRPRRVRILGATGYNWDVVRKADIKGNFDVMVSTGATEEQNMNLMRDRFGEYVKRNRLNPRLNQKFMDEKEAQIFGFSKDEVGRLLNPDLEGNWEIIAEAAAENEKLIKKDVKPNQAADTGHIEKHLEYVRETSELSPEIRKRILAHAKSEIPIAQRNEALKANKLIREQFGARNMEIDEKIMETVANPPPDRSQPVPEGVDPAEYAAALQAKEPPAPVPAEPIPESEAVRFEAIRNAPNATAAMANGVT